MNKENKRPQTKIIVKLPDFAPREHSAKSNEGDFGSGSDENENVGNGTLIYNDNESIASDISDYSDGSNRENQNVTDLNCDEFSLSLAKYKSTLKRKGENSCEYRTYIQTLPSITNITADLPEAGYFHVQNPFSLKYKERSFYIKTSDDHRPPGSARLSSRRKPSFDSNNKDTSQSNKSRTKRVDWSGNTVTEKGSQVIVSGHMADIQVFGRKPDGVPKADLPTPPNTPTKREKERHLRPKQSQCLGQIVLAQKRARMADMVRIFLARQSFC